MSYQMFLIFYIVNLINLDEAALSSLQSLLKASKTPGLIVDHFQYFDPFRSYF